MSNELEQKAKTLAQMLADNHLTKIASDQQIEHTSPEAQTGIGKEQTNEIKDEIEGVIASTDAAANKDKAEVDTPPNNQNLNTDAKAALANTGTTVDVMEQDGEKTTLKTATVQKTAADYQHELAQTLAKLRAQSMQKRAAAQEQQVDPENFRTGTEVMEKVASLREKVVARGGQPTEAELNELHDEMTKLASTNPLFRICRDNILMNKLAADADALAEAEGMSPEDAAAQLDAAAAADPSIMASAEDEANGEALAELANAEAGADELMGGVEELAANASNALGQEVTSDDILNAIDEVQAQAEQLGVPPEALIQAAAEQMAGGMGGAEVTPDDEANAQAIMEEAAARGVSPDEVLQMAAGELDNGGGAPAEPAPDAAAAEKPAEEKTAEAKSDSKSDDKKDEGEKKDDGEKKDEGEKKEASFKQAATPRAAYVQSLMHAKK